MTGKKESKFTLEWVKNILYITLGIIVLLSGFFATYTNSLLSPIEHTQQYFDRELNEIGIKLNKMDDEVDNNRHAIAILNSHMQRNK